MAWTPLGLQDNDAAHAASAVNVESWLLNTYNQAIADASGGGTGVDWTNAQTAGITPGTGNGAANLTALNNLITTLNSSGGNVYFPAGTYDIGGTPSTITHSNVHIFGAGKGRTTLRLTSGAGGQMFKFGNATGAGIANIVVRDMTIQVLTPAASLTATHSLFYLTNTDWFVIENIHVTDIAGFIRLGTDQNDVSRTQVGVVRGISGNYADVNASVIWCRVAAGVNFYDIEMHGPAGGTDQGIPIHLDAYNPTALSDSGCEALRFSNCAIWSAWKTPTTGGQPRGIYLDFTNGSILNCWWLNGESDWNSTAGVQIYAASGTNFCRNMQFHGWYLNNGGWGHGVLINPDAGFVRDISIDRCRMPMFDKPAVKLSGAGSVTYTSLIGNKFMDKDATTTKTCAVESSHSRFTLIGNAVRHISDATVNVDYFLRLTADVDFFTVMGNNVANLNIGFVNHFAYASASVRRIVANNIDPTAVFSIAAAATITLPDEGHMFNVTGTATINSIRPAWDATGSGTYGRRITLYWPAASTASVSEAGNVRLAGTGTFAGTADDTLTLVCDGTKWIEQSRSVN